jgi:hypothetical protein
MGQAAIGALIRSKPRLNRSPAAECRRARRLFCLPAQPDVGRSSFAASAGDRVRETISE